MGWVVQDRTHPYVPIHTKKNKGDISTENLTRELTVSRRPAMPPLRKLCARTAWREWTVVKGKGRQLLSALEEESSSFTFFGWCDMRSIEKTLIKHFACCILHRDEGWLSFHFF